MSKKKDKRKRELKRRKRIASRGGFRPAGSYKRIQAHQSKRTTGHPAWTTNSLGIFGDLPRIGILPLDLFK